MGITQPLEYPKHDPETLDDVLKVYGVTPSENRLLDLAETTLIFRVDMPDTDDEVLELTSGRYDGLRFSGVSGKLLPAKPITPKEGP